MPGTRREFRTSAAAGAAALALPRAARSQGTRQVAAGFATYVTEPSLKPPTLTVATLENPSAGYLFATTLTGPGQRGPGDSTTTTETSSGSGRRVRSRSVSGPRSTRASQCSPGGKGRSHSIGTGSGVGMIVDSSYQPVAQVHAGNGYLADLHEFLITRKGTALITVFDDVTLGPLARRRPARRGRRRHDVSGDRPRNGPGDVRVA